MFPDFILFGKVISYYMIVSLAGVLITLYFSYVYAKKSNLNEITMLYTALFAFVGVILGGHILYGITNIKLMIYILKNVHLIDGVKSFIDYAQVVFGGSVFYGGLFGALILGYIYLKKAKQNVLLYLNVGAIAIPLFHFFGRIGCFLSGCCYGIECDFGFTYHYSVAPNANGVSRFPIQLVEALFNLIIFIILYKISKNKKQCNLVILYLGMYAPIRFTLEFFRGDVYRGFLFGISTSQWISITIMIFLSIYFILKFYKKRKQLID